MKFRTAFLGMVFLLCTTQAFGQSCSMCYSTAKATSKEGQRAISKGVVVLLFPPLGFMTFGLWMAFRYGKKRDIEQNEQTFFVCSPGRRFSSPTPVHTGRNDGAWRTLSNAP
jgi:hypothetical protein